MSVQCPDCGAVAGYGRELAHKSDCPSLRPHKVMTPEEYAAMPIKGWHEVCRDVDGFGGVGIRYLGLALPNGDR